MARIEPDMDGPPVESKNFEVIWGNLSYVVKKNWFERLLARTQGHQSVERKKTILKHVEGRFKSGELTAIMGPSGAGKSTLLECIAGRRMKGRSGHITITGNLKRVKMSFIPQHDNYYEVLTVNECIVFASKLQNSTKALETDYMESVVSQPPPPGIIVGYKRRMTISHKDFHSLVADNIITLLGLEKCAHVASGSISGGQQKRLSIAQELVSKPNILILDEPTSGLDSSACFQTVELLHKLTQQSPPMAIVATIHQPSGKVFNLFHKIYMLSVGGKCIYDGSPLAVADYLLNFPGLECPNFYNPADHLIEVAAGEYGADRLKLLSNAIDATYLGGDHVNVAGLSPTVRVLQKVAKHPKYPKQKHFLYLFHRSVLLIVRDPMLMSLRFGMHTFIALFVGYLYGHRIGQVGGCPPDIADGFNPLKIAEAQRDTINDMKDIMDNLSNLFFNTMIIFFGSLMPTLLTFPMEMSIFVKEKNNGWYGTGTYYLAKMLADIPFVFIFPTIYVVITYYMNSQIPVFWRFSSYLWLLILMALIGQCFGLIFGAFFMYDPMSAVFIAPLSTLPFFLFSGFLVKIENMPNPLKPLTWISPMRFAMEGVIISIYGFGRCLSDMKRLEMVKEVFTNWLGSVFKLVSNNDEDYYDDVLVANVSTMAISKEAPFDGKALSKAIVDTLLGGMGGSLVDDDGQVMSGVMTIFSLQDNLLLLCFIMLIVNFVVLRVITYLLVLWRANEKK